METLKLDMAGILEYQKNRFPYLMIDVAEEVVPGKSAKGFKHLTANDWFFECHFPGDPNMPGMLQIEALVQMSALALVTLPGNKGKVCYLTSADKLLFKRKIVAGDRFDIETEVVSFKRGIAKLKGTGSIAGQLACKAEFSLVLPDIIESFRVAGKAD
jgi:3-hydroxyacyl-[acyl-carrier-protein] dehydratase